jgi:hypothetical protein
MSPYQFKQLIVESVLEKRGTWHRDNPVKRRGKTILFQSFR